MAQTNNFGAQLVSVVDHVTNNPVGAAGLPTHRASTSGLLVAAASTAPFHLLYGSASKIIRPHFIVVKGITLTAVEYLTILLTKYSAAVGAGGTIPANTIGSPTKIPLDSSGGASSLSLLANYTTGPTAGAAVGVLASARVLAQATTAAAAGTEHPDIVFDLRGLVLRGVAEGIGLSFLANPGSTPSMMIEDWWAETAA